MQARGDGDKHNTNGGEGARDVSCFRTADTRREGSDFADCREQSGAASTRVDTMTGEAGGHERPAVNLAVDTASLPSTATTSGVVERGDIAPAKATTTPSPLARSVPPSSPTTQGRCKSGCSTPPSPSRTQRPPYLAAGVLPFCVLGGDLLFLLGQQPRFRSRLKRYSFSETKGVSTSASSSSGGRAGSPGSIGGSGDGGSLESASVRRPRRAPHPKLSLPSPPFPPVVVADMRGTSRQDHPHAADPPSPSRISPSKARGLPAPPRASVPATGVREAADEDAASPPPRPPPPVGALTMEERRGAAGQPGALAGINKQSPPLVEESPRDEIVGAATVCGFASSDAKVDPPKDRSTVGAYSSTSFIEQQGRGGVKPRGYTSDARSVPHVAGATPEGQVPAGLLWSDFGGGREAGDVDAEGTASREFAEESFGLFHGVRLESDSVARSQEAMEAALRDPSLRGKRVFESRNGGYVMFIAAVNFVPDIMMKLARKEILDGGGGNGESGEGGTAADTPHSDREGGSLLGGWGSSPGFSEKTDFAWVPASSLLGAMRESRNRSTRRVVVKLGGCRYLRLFHKFVISLWGLDLAEVIKAASTPLPHRDKPFPAPRVLLLKSAGEGGNNPGNGDENRAAEGNREGAYAGKPRGRPVGRMAGDGVGITEAGVARCAIRGIDCIRPSVLSGRKRTSLGIVDKRNGRLGPSGRWVSGGGGGGGGGGGDDGPRFSVDDGCEGSVASVGQGGGGRRSRGKKSGAACRKRRRQCKEARRLKMAAAAAVMQAAAGGAETAKLCEVAQG